MPPATLPTPAPPTAHARAAPRPLRIALGLLVFAAAVLAFAPAFTAPFIGLDDVTLLLSHENYHGFTAANIKWMFTSTLLGHWQPLTWVSYAVDYTFWGMNPSGYHATNIAVHALNAVLLNLLASRLLALARPAGSPVAITLGAAAAALLWAVHPLRVESVAWVTERRDVLSTFFLLLAALAYLRAVKPGQGVIASPRAYAASIALLAVSLLCKAWGMTFFAVLLLVDLYPLRRLPWNPFAWLTGPSRDVVLQKLPYLALGLASAFMAATASRSTGEAMVTLERWTILDRCLQACYGLMFYLWKTVAPTRLSVMYEMPMHLSPTETRILAALIVVPAAALAVFLLRQKLPALPAAALAYVVVVLPALGFLQSGPQLVADRYSYIAVMGLMVAIGGGLSIALERLRVPARAALLASLTALLAVCGVATWRQTTIWQDNERLLGRVIELGHAGLVFQLRYADWIARQGRPEQALPILESIVAQHPNYGEAWASLGSLLRAQGRPASAEQALRKGMIDHPQAWKPAVELALMLLNENELNRPADAIAVLEFAIADVERPGRAGGLTPGGDGHPYLVMAMALDLNGDAAGAYAMLQKAAQYPGARGQALARMRDLEEEARRQRGVPGL